MAPSAHASGGSAFTTVSGFLNAYATEIMREDRRHINGAQFKEIVAKSVTR